jgi:hypothetical protein
VSEPTAEDMARDLEVELRRFEEFGVHPEADPFVIIRAAIRRALAAEAELRRLKAPGGDPLRKSVSVEDVMEGDT